MPGDITNLVESATAQTVKLTELYDEDALNDESEAIYHHVSGDELETPFTVHDALPDVAKSFTTLQGDMTVWNAFKKFGSREQKAIVKNKRTSFNAGRIIVVSGKAVIDGNHHLIAALLDDRPVRYIDITEHT